MSTADNTLSTRSDAHAFAAAFAAADDAFTADRPGESRTLTLAELEAVLELDTPVDLPVERPLRTTSSADAEPGLLTLAQLGAVLAQPSADADVLDFDFGTGTAERARRRTAARSGHVPESPRRGSGPAGPRGSSAGPADDGRGIADPPAAVSGADRAGASGDGVSPERVHWVPPAAPPRTTAMAMPLAPPPAAMAVPLVPPTAARRRPASRMALPTPARRPLPGSGTVQRFRAEPDRIALYAVLLGILLVLIAASSSAA